MLVLIGCGLIELAVQRRPALTAGLHWAPLAALAPATVAVGGLGALAWTAFKVGALAYGGGFVIIPLMQGDAVDTYHWMTNAQFLNAVALGQVTPGPVTATVAAVGYAAHGLSGGLLAATVAFVPSFSFILIGGGRFGRLRESPSARAFLDGAGPAAIGAILGAAIPLTGALRETWQYAVLAAAAIALLALRRSVVQTLLVRGGDRRRAGARGRADALEPRDRGTRRGPARRLTTVERGSDSSSRCRSDQERAPSGDVASSRAPLSERPSRARKTSPRPTPSSPSTTCRPTLKATALVVEIA